MTRPLDPGRQGQESFAVDGAVAPTGNASAAVGEGDARTGPAPGAGQHAFEVSDGIACLRVAGSYSFAAAIALVDSALAQAFQQRHDRLLVVANEVFGFDPPGVPARHQMMRQWAAAARTWVRLALVVRGELIDPEKFGVLAGRNFGFVSDVFESEPDALDWLRTLEPLRR